MASYDAFRNLLFRLEPERAHRLTLQMLALAGAIPALRSGMRRIFSFEDPALRVRAFGLEFANPVGLAAGYDKDGLAMHGLACLGFGHLELGTVTSAPQQGNPRPRLFRLAEDQALINRMGFPNQGVSRMLERLKKRPAGIVLGINIGKSAETPIQEASRDYTRLMELVYESADYLAINVSSPNTTGLRQLQGRRYLEDLLSDLAGTRARLIAESGKSRPVLVKLAPDLDDTGLEQAIEVIQGTGMDGIIVANTTTSRDGLRAPSVDESGGLSGLPLFRRSTDMIRHVRAKTGGGLPIIGVGGVFGPEQALEKLNAGATLIQMYTGLIYRGPGLIREILVAVG
ncbi:MAG: quinone-dependent dihydroorotate dehydrogenase [Anaerolineae bacterium]|nr:MAG: quinone-dependent dihydroorotate dehydrogenase [Anaerolineae bacterium]